MRFRQFVRWCERRSQEGTLGHVDTVRCLQIINEMYFVPFWKRNKAWHNEYEEYVLKRIVNPIDEMRRYFKKADRLIKKGDAKVYVINKKV